MLRCTIFVLLFGTLGCKSDGVPPEAKPEVVPSAPTTGSAAVSKVDPMSLFGEDATVAVVELEAGFMLVVGAQEYEQPKPMVFLLQGGSVVDRADPKWLHGMVDDCDSSNSLSARKEGPFVVVQNECSGGEDALYTDTHAVVLTDVSRPTSIKEFIVRWSGQVGAMTSNQVSGCEWGDNGELTIEGGHGFVVTTPWRDRHEAEDTDTACSDEGMTPSKTQVF